MKSSARFSFTEYRRTTGRRAGAHRTIGLGERAEQPFPSWFDRVAYLFDCRVASGDAAILLAAFSMEMAGFPFDAVENFG